MKKEVVLSIPEKQLEHELFRACMQAVVGIRQQHRQEAQLAYAKRLEELAIKHIGSQNFHE